MTLHIGNKNVYDIRAGNRIIDFVYKGSVLVWQKYKVLFESSTPGTYSLNLPTAMYKITVVGGGGGSATAAGGAGAFIQFTMKTSGNVTITVGAGGRGAYSYAYIHTAENGGESSVRWGQYSAVCPGGKGGIGYRDGDEDGSKSTYTYAPSYNLPTATINGASTYYRPRQDSWYNGYGRGADAVGKRAEGLAGASGYVKIETV